MKWLPAMLIAFALFMRGDPLCATPPVPMAMSSVECGDMGSDDGPQHDDDQNMARACHACMFARMDTPTAPQSPHSPKLVPVVPAPKQMSETAIEPPTPPPRAGAPLAISII